jgi:hypothetical protein
MPAGFFVDGKLTYKPLVSVVTEFASTTGLGPANKVLAVVGEFPFLQKEIPYLFTSQAAFLGALPANATMRELANLIYNPSSSAPFNGSPAGVILVNAQTSTQAEGALKGVDAADAVKFLANTWGLGGNSTVVVVTKSASTSDWTAVISNRGLREEFAAGSGLDTLELSYDYNGAAGSYIPVLGFGNDGDGGSTGELKLTKLGDDATISFTRTLTQNQVRSSESDLSWIPDGPVNGTLVVTPSGILSAAIGVTPTLKVKISGVNASTLGPDSETLTFSVAQVLGEDPQTTEISFSSVSGVTMTLTGTDATWTGTAAVSGVVTTVGPAAGYETVAQVIQYLNSVKGFSATTKSFKASTTLFKVLDEKAATALPTTLNSSKASLLAALSKSSLITIEDLEVGGPALDVDPGETVSVMLQGGTQAASATSTEWQAAFLALATSPVTVLFPYSNNHDVHVAAFDHVKYMWGKGQRECQLVVAPPPNTTLSNLNVKRRDLADFRVTMLPHSVRVANPDGTTSAFSTLYTGLLFAAMQCGNPEVGLPMGGARPRVLAFSGDASIMGTDGADTLLANSMTPLEDMGDGIRVVRWVTTYSEDNDPVRTEGSAVEALAFSNIAVRLAVRPFLNTKATPAVAPAIRSTIASEVSSHVYRGILRSWQPDSLVVQETDSAYIARYTISPVLPVNYIAITSVAIAFPIS